MIVVVVLVSGITGARAVAQATDEAQEQAIATIEKLGGKVERVDTPSHRFMRVALSRTEVSEGRWASLEALKDLQVL